MEIITDESKLPKEILDLLEENKESYPRYKIAYEYIPPDGLWEMHLYKIVMKPLYIEQQALFFQIWFHGKKMENVNKVFVDKQLIQMFWGL